MTKKIKKQTNNVKKQPVLPAKKQAESHLPQKKYSFFQPLVSKKYPTTIVPVVTGSDADFTQSLNKLTGGNYVSPTVFKTPKGRNIEVDSSGVCGITASGSKLIYSPSKKLNISVTTPAGKNKTSIDLYLLVREKDYVPKLERTLFFELNDQPVVERTSFSVVASNETRSDQPPRKKARKELAVVKKSAKQIVCDYFKACGMPVPQAELEKENWNLCHLLSYAISMNAKTESGEAFNSQTRENIFSGSRVLNENMMRIENVLLEMIKKNNVSEIEYMAIHSEFEESHILAKLTLKVSIKTLDGGRTIHFDYPFDISDDRKLSPEASTIYYATLMGLVDSLNSLEKDDDAPKPF